VWLFRHANRQTDRQTNADRNASQVNCVKVKKSTVEKSNKYVRLCELTYIHTCRSHVHTPRERDRHAVESPTGTLIVLHAMADSSDFGLLGEQSSPKCEIPCPGRRRTALQNLTPLALSSAEKSVSVQTNEQTKLQTVTDIHTLPIGMCGQKLSIVNYFKLCLSCNT